MNYSFKKSNDTIMIYCDQIELGAVSYTEKNFLVVISNNGIKWKIPYAIVK